jgi:hypothetical protein
VNAHAAAAVAKAASEKNKASREASLSLNLLTICRLAGSISGNICAQPVKPVRRNIDNAMARAITFAAPENYRAFIRHELRNPAVH